MLPNMRHTFATTVTLAQGVPLETVSKMLGHKRIITTQITNDKIGQDMAALSEKLDSVFKLAQQPGAIPEYRIFIISRHLFPSAGNQMPEMEIRKTMRIARGASLAYFHPRRFAGRYRRNRRHAAARTLPE